MKKWKSLATAAAIGLSVGCNSGNSPAPENPSKTQISCRVGEIFRDIYLFNPPDSKSFKTPEEVDKTIIELRRRILFAAGPDAAGMIDSSCREGVAAIACSLAKSQATIDLLNKFGDAISVCYKGPTMPDGSPDLKSGGDFDINCFVDATKSVAPGSPGDHESLQLQCSRALYDCYSTGYSELKKDVINGK